MDIFKSKPKQFKVGQLIITDDVTNMMEDDTFRTFVYVSYLRYIANDWGDLDKKVKKLNRRNIKHGGNLGGRYLDEEHGWCIIIITPETHDRTIISLEG